MPQFAICQVIKEQNDLFNYYHSVEGFCHSYGDIWYKQTSLRLFAGSRLGSVEWVIDGEWDGDIGGEGWLRR